MKKIIICALAVLSVATVLTACGKYNCSYCYDKCSDKHSINDGEVVICNDCYNKLFKDTAESDPEEYYARVENK